MHRLIYSFIVDAPERFQQQAHIFLRSLLATGVGPHRIHAHLTPGARAQPDLVETLSGYGVVLHDLEPFLDGAYCNKLVQLDSLPLSDGAYVALCDTDLAFLQSLDSLAHSGVVRGKPVDLPNPPLALLEEARRVCGLEGEQPIVTTSCDPAQTWASNCNGGVYLLPARLAPSIAARWKVHAATLFANRDFLGNYAHHIDQIAFAMAMLDLGLAVEPLPIEDNFPLHLSECFPPDADLAPRILHYHGLHDGSAGLIAPGHPSLDRAVDALNARLQAA